MAGWVESDWVQEGWVESDVAVTGTPIVLPNPGEVRGATCYGDPHALELIYHQNPGPYSDEAIFILKTWSGQRLFGHKIPPDAVLADDLGRFDSLVTSSDVAITTVPLGNDLVGSIGTTERPRATETLRHDRRFWSQLVVTEPLLAMPAGRWLHYGGGDTHLLLQGQVERVVIRLSQVTLEYGEP